MDDSDKQIDLNGKPYKRLRGQWIDCNTGLVPPLVIIDKLDRLLYQKYDPSKIPPASSLIFFWTWKNYISDMSDMQQSEKTYELNHNNSLMHSLRKRDHIWAFARRDDITYVLAMDLVVEFTRQNKPGDLGAKYGKYCAVGNPQACRYFDVKTAPDAEPTIRESHFFTDNVKVDTTGKMFEGINAVRSLTIEEHLKLMGLSQKCRELEH